MNKSPGPDTIHAGMIHEIAESVAVPLTYIFKTSLATRTLPNEWKHAYITATLKKAEKLYHKITDP